MKFMKNKINQRLNILNILVIVIMMFLLLFLFYIQIIKNDFYRQKMESLKVTTYYGKTAPRGRILDRNGIIIVDNEPVRVIAFKNNNLSSKEKIDLAYEVIEHIDLDYSKLTERMIKDFWMIKFSDKAKEKITKEEWKKYTERKITNTEIDNLQRDRITKEDINLLNDEDKKVAYLYYLMTNGYSYTEKIIKDKNVTDQEYAYVSTNNLNGFTGRISWDRTYPFSSTFKSILGSVSTSEVGIPKDLKEHYQNTSYELDDRVGISYLEYQYDEYLKGKKDIYEKVNNKDILKQEGNRGNDIYLTIDINLQKEIENILKEELIKAKKEKNTKYYDRSFVIITNPKTGEILAMSGKKIQKVNNEYVIYDYTPGIFTESVTVGSVIKGASQIVGYNNGAVKIGENRYDKCVKLKNTPLKCSWKNLGKLNDITALKYSSNTYQFYTALKVAGYNYSYNASFDLKNDPFKIYRETFNQFGLGVSTGIDLPNEFIGIKGTNDTIGLLLDFSIGQYDTYTPLQLAQYISTIANNGNRMSMHLLNKVISSNDGEMIYVYENKILNKVETKSEYMDRVHLGLEEVLKTNGTGSGYISLKYKPAGKTGTSQSFIDSNFDGKVDKETLSHTFAAYAPYDDATVAFVVVSPNVYYNEGSAYTTNVNKRITKKVSEAYFNLYNNG